MELHEALTQIAEIRARVAAAESFRGYRAAPVAATGVLAGLAAVAQPYHVPDPAADLPGYLALWLTVASGAAATAAAGVWRKLREPAADPLGGELTRLAVAQFLPCVAAGALVTAAIARHAPQAGWMMPGLWQVLFGLGLFASCRLVPRAVAGVGAWYLLAGTANLCRGEAAAYSPWAMGLPFGIGQLATAAVLYWHLERWATDAD